MAILNAIPQSDEQVCGPHFFLDYFYFALHVLSLSLLNESFPTFLQYDPFAEHRPQKIAEREDEYKQRRRQMIISPERLDPFADGKF